MITVFSSTYDPILKDNGAVNASGKLYFYKIGTSTAKDTYTSTALTTANANPVILNSAGLATVVLDGDYKLIIKDSSDVTIRTINNLNPAQTDVTHLDWNVIENGSFEIDTDADGIPDYWTRSDNTGSTNSLDTSNTGHGKKSQKFVSAGSGGGYIESSVFYACSPNEDLNWSFEIKATNASARNTVIIQWYQADETASVSGNTTIYDKSSNNPSAWTMISGAALPPSDAKLFKVRLTGIYTGASGTTWFDNVRFGTTPQVEIDIGLTLGVTGSAPII